MVHCISLGAGVQSSTMALMAKHGLIKPMPDFAIFADTKSEPKSVYDWLDYLETELPFPVKRLTNMIGMSVPPKMTEQVARAVIEQWLKKQ